MDAKMRPQLNGIGLSRAGERVLRVLEDAGLEAWVVGGWVRDALRGDAGHDVDLCCSGSWQDSEAALRAAGIRVVESGIRFGGITAVEDGERIEVTTYRLDGFYTDGRHPEQVTRAERVEDDLARRDFTVNAMAWHPERGLLDLYDGAGDLARGLIRAVGDPRRRFEEDALRVLRAVRFACRLDAAIEPATQAALEACAPELDQIASERIGQELDGILATGRAAWALRHEFAVLSAAVPELAPMAGFDQRSPYHAHDVLEHTARVCAGAEEFAGGRPLPALRWAALLHDVAKPSCWSEDVSGRGHFFGHPEEGARVARRVMGRLAVPGEVTRAAAALVLLHDFEIRATAPSMRRMLSELEAAAPGQARPLAFALLDLKRADAVAKAPACMGYAVELDAMTAVLRAELSAGAVWRVRDLAVGGADVIRERGVEPGPGVGMVLAQLLEAVKAGEVPNRRDALLAWLRW